MFPECFNTKPECLIPLYQDLETAAELLIEAPPDVKTHYISLIEKAMKELHKAKYDLNAKISRN
jgi:hypothetical protein